MLQVWTHTHKHILLEERQQIMISLFTASGTKTGREREGGREGDIDLQRRETDEDRCKKKEAPGGLIHMLPVSSF